MDRSFGTAKTFCFYCSERLIFSVKYQKDDSQPSSTNNQDYAEAQTTLLRRHFSWLLQKKLNS